MTPRIAPSARGGTALANTTWHKLQLRRVNGVFTTTVNDATLATTGTTTYNISASQLVLGGNTSKPRVSKGASEKSASVAAHAGRRQQFRQQGCSLFRLTECPRTTL